MPENIFWMIQSSIWCIVHERNSSIIIVLWVDKIWLWFKIILCFISLLLNMVLFSCGFSSWVSFTCFYMCKEKKSVPKICYFLDSKKKKGWCFSLWVIVFRARSNSTFANTENKCLSRSLFLLTIRTPAGFLLLSFVNSIQLSWYALSIIMCQKHSNNVPLSGRSSFVEMNF